MTNNSQIAGILSIISGVFGVFSAGLIIMMLVFMNAIFHLPEEINQTAPRMMDTFSNFFILFYGVMGGVLALIAILAIIGGVYSIKKKYWGLGLAGAIAGTVTFFPCGIAAIILISMGKSEFDRPLAVPPVAQPTPQP